MVHIRMSYLKIGMTMSFLHEVLPQLPPRKTSQNGGGGGGEGEGHNQSLGVYLCERVRGGRHVRYAPNLTIEEQRTSYYSSAVKRPPD